MEGMGNEETIVATEQDTPSTEPTHQEAETISANAVDTMMADTDVENAGQWNTSAGQGASCSQPGENHSGIIDTPAERLDSGVLARTGAGSNEPRNTDEDEIVSEPTAMHQKQPSVAQEEHTHSNDARWGSPPTQGPEPKDGPSETPAPEETKEEPKDQSKSAIITFAVPGDKNTPNDHYAFVDLVPQSQKDRKKLYDKIQANWPTSDPTRWFPQQHRPERMPENPLDWSNRYLEFLLKLSGYTPGNMDTAHHYLGQAAIEKRESIMGKLCAKHIDHAHVLANRADAVHEDRERQGKRRKGGDGTHVDAEDEAPVGEAEIETEAPSPDRKRKIPAKVDYESNAEEDKANGKAKESAQRPILNATEEEPNSPFDVKEEFENDLPNCSRAFSISSVTSQPRTYDPVHPFRQSATHSPFSAVAPSAPRNAAFWQQRRPDLTLDANSSSHRLGGPPFSAGELGRSPYQPTGSPYDKQISNSTFVDPFQRPSTAHGFLNQPTHQQQSRPAFHRDGFSHQQQAQVAQRHLYQAAPTNSYRRPIQQHPQQHVPGGIYPLYVSNGRQLSKWSIHSKGRASIRHKLLTSEAFLRRRAKGCSILLSHQDLWHHHSTKSHQQPRIICSSLKSGA